MYYIYKTDYKVGLTNNPCKRLKEQGLDSTYVIEQYESVVAASIREIELQKQFNFQIDNLYFKMQKDKLIYVSNQTVTLKDVNVIDVYYFLENLGEITIDGETFELTERAIRRVQGQFIPSYKVKGSVYAYKKPLVDMLRSVDWEATIDDTVDDIYRWAEERGLYESGDPKTQTLKLQEEVGELARAILKGEILEQKDAVGDIFVVLVNLSRLLDLDIAECIFSAYDEIKNRKGKMINNTFVKE